MKLRPSTLLTQLPLSLSLFGAIGLSIEAFLNLYGASLCQTSACEVVGQYLTIPESFLITAGAGFFWCLALLFFFASRYPDFLSRTPLLLLIPALAIDGTLIGYQIFTIKEQCILCLTVAAVLLIISICYSLTHKVYIVTLCCLLAWGGGFAANSIVKMPEPAGASHKMSFYQYPEQVTTPDSLPTATLIFSMHCSHCLDVISFLADQDLTGTVWRLAAIDQDNEALQQLTLFLQQAQDTSSPFALLKKIKQSSALATFSPLPFLKETSTASRTYLNNLGINSIPLLIIDQHDDKIQFFSGSTAIINGLEAIIFPLSSNNIPHSSTP